MKGSSKGSTLEPLSQAISPDKTLNNGALMMIRNENLFTSPATNL